MKEFSIGDHLISKTSKPFVVAEMSGNHNQSLETALSIVDAAAKAGAHAIKLQTYTADTMTLNVDRNEFKILDKKSLWYGRRLYELYREAHTPWEWHEPIMRRAKELGIICFSAPFDETAVDFLETLNVPAYKIASFENTDVRLLRRVARTKKPVIISTGMASLNDLELMVNTMREEKCENFILLKCTSAYPAQPSDANLRTLPHLSAMFDCPVGLSDHTMGVGVAIAAVALGAVIIEKHFTLSRAAGGVDAAFSLEPEELKLLVSESEKAWQSLGRVNYKTSNIEEKSKQFRRSIYFSQDMKTGDIITEAAVRCVRPGYGLPIKHYDALIGLKLKRSVSKGEAVKWDVFV
ncbi:MAG: pseudaminic acid synthase [Gammaproteobacteria bacterium RIFCSPHIGHO2_12_FULL_38_14]|nr:MAG: pseudaminic acid synthase [Gammaproteobacteria bacterium RIFCSPHIGHO2_12_FULL_38_14]